jgi:thiol:disulfide interchange protein DsbD
MNALSTNPFFNVVLFALLIVFGASFLGAFELQLPTSWTNFFDKKADTTSGLVSLFFMAFTLGLVSFSCTGPIIGTLLVEAASSGSKIGPLVGMFGFSLALALPFSFFAIFPSLLGKLPRSGGWLNTVKVVLGFLEIAFALKFLSTADLAAHWNILPRETFLSLWIILFTLLGFYLLGKLNFAHDSEIKHISVTRFFMALISLSFALYMVPGLWGAPLKAISAFSPPQQTQDFDLYTNALSSSNKNKTNTKKYAAIFHSPYNLNSFFDYDEGMEYARKVNKPVLIDFTGHGCVNCRKMEVSVWSNKSVLNLLTNEYVLISLYVDDRTALPVTEQKDVRLGDKTMTIKTIGNKWSYFEASKYGTNSQPYYLLLDNKGELLSEPGAYDLNIDHYISFLENGLTEYKKRNTGR